VLSYRSIPPTIRQALPTNRHQPRQWFHSRFVVLEMSQYKFVTSGGPDGVVFAPASTAVRSHAIRTALQRRPCQSTSTVADQARVTVRRRAELKGRFRLPGAVSRKPASPVSKSPENDNRFQGLEAVLATNGQKVVEHGENAKRPTALAPVPCLLITFLSSRLRFQYLIMMKRGTKGHLTTRLCHPGLQNSVATAPTHSIASL
jgi:hypothetical protein